MKWLRTFVNLALLVAAAALLAACADMPTSGRDSNYNNYGGHSGHGGHH